MSDELQSPKRGFLRYRSLFKGREDVFAIRWEKGKKSGYMPAYQYDPYLYRLHKMKGGTFSNYPDKSYRKLSDQEIIKHIEGQQFIGVYPLLQDNTSHFIVADFDKISWVEDCRNLIEACKKLGVDPYLERSRSGNGGHVWIFFESPYPAAKSRKILMSLLHQTGGVSVFDKGSSFDRLFPNQDYLSGKGFGNLIALPLHRNCLELGNNCFISPENLEAYPDQWAFLRSIKRVPVPRLDQVYESIVQRPPNLIEPNANPLQLIIKLNNAVYLNRSAIPIKLINFLKEELNLSNTEFYVKQQSGRSTWKTKRYFKLINEKDSEVIIPKGFVGKIIKFCRQHQIYHELVDQRKQHKNIDFQHDISLRPHQKTAVAATEKKQFGIIVAPPGSGKTVMALRIVASKQQPALIIVHRKQLLEQWLERIEAFLGIPKKEIGIIGQGKWKVGNQVTLAMVQTLSKKIDTVKGKKLTEHFGTLILDECHHVPAETFQHTISKFNTYYQYGLTATPFRKYSDGKLIFMYLGDIIAEIKPQQIETFKRPRIVIRNTSLEFPFHPKTDRFETLANVIIHDSVRNQLILKDITQELQKGQKVLVITERREHIQTLHQFLKQSYETITLSGEDSEIAKKVSGKL